MSGMPLLTKFALALVLLWTCGPAAVRPTLVAYYSFDGASVGLVEGLSGYCPNVVSPGTLSGTATIISGQCKYGDCLDPGSDGSMQLTQQLFQGRGASANSVSFSLWVRRTGTNNFVYILSKRELVGVLYVPGGGEGGRDVVGDRHKGSRSLPQCARACASCKCCIMCRVLCRPHLSGSRPLTGGVHARVEHQRGCPGNGRSHSAT